jgi:hypothetical protein
MAVRPITDILPMLRMGEAVEEASKKMNELIQAVDNTGKPGTFILKITVKPSTSGALELTDDIAIKKPEGKKGSSLFFATPEGNLQRNDPRQNELPGLKVIQEETRELKTAT